MTVCEPNVNIATVGPKILASICAPIPCPGKYSFTISWSGICVNSPSCANRLAIASAHDGKGPNASFLDTERVE